MSGAIVIPTYGTIYDIAGEQAGFLREAAERIRTRHSRVTTEMIDIGTELSAVKERTDHGLFLGWLEHEVNMEPRLAQKYMRAAKWASENTKLVSHLQPTAVMDLAAKSTPPAVIEAVVRKVDAGEKVSPTAVRRLMSAAREEKQEQERLAKEAAVPKRTREARKARQERESKELAEGHRKRMEEKTQKLRDSDELAEILISHLDLEVLDRVKALLQNKSVTREYHCYHEGRGAWRVRLVDLVEVMQRQRGVGTSQEALPTYSDMPIKLSQPDEGEDSDDNPDFVPAFLKAG